MNSLYEMYSVSNNIYFNVPKFVYRKYEEMISYGEDTTLYVQIMFDLYYVLENELSNKEFLYLVSDEDLFYLKKSIKRLHTMDDFHILPFHIKKVLYKIMEIKNIDIF